MYSKGTSAYFDFIDGLEALPPDEARRLLSRSYTAVKSAAIEAESLHVGELASRLQQLRRLASALETNLIVSRDMPQDVREASAFVAAESLEIASRISARLFGTDYDVEGSIWSPTTHDAIESALLYFVSQHYTNANIVANDVLPRRVTSAAEMPSIHATFLYDAILALITLDSTRLTEEPDIDDLSSIEYASHIARAMLAQQVGSTVVRYLRWLRYESDESPAGMTEDLRALGERLRTVAPGRHQDFENLIWLLSLVFEDSQTKALRTAPWPEDREDDRASYLRARCKDRPLLWPPAVAYSRETLPGPRANAVVSVPTGSGKSFVAEIALVQALMSGFAVYLAPTNALANQIRRDLSRKLEYSDEFRVQAFLGGQEFTLLQGETPASVPSGTVVVMTPEKCALALRLSPDAFANASLVVFDECHLIGEGGSRGATAELVVSHLTLTAPNALVLMLSALVANPRDLAQWLTTATERECIVVDTPWRPTRTLRGVVGVDQATASDRIGTAQQELASLPDHRKNMKFGAPLCALLNMQGPWSDDSAEDYGLIGLPIDADLKVTRQQRRDRTWRYGLGADSYVNESTARLCNYLARQNERVLAFVPRSRNDPFSVADRIVSAETIPANPIGELVEASLTCAEYELGAASQVSQLLRSGVGTHSSAMIDEERHAAERAFEQGSARVLVATGTLAQGLNLPASVVVVGGTKLAGGRGDTSDNGHLRAQLLNAIGRAGRARYASHGLALVVPDEVIYVDDRATAVGEALGLVDFLQHEDASTTVDSSLRQLLGMIDAGAVTLESLSLAEMTAFTYAPLDRTSDDGAEILARSFAMQAHAPDADREYARRISDGLKDLGEAFLIAAEVPEWLVGAAYRAGVPLPILFSVYRSCVQLGLPAEPIRSIDAWLRRMINVLSVMDRVNCAQLLWSDSLLGGSNWALSGFRFAILAQVGGLRDSQEVREAWRSLFRVIDMYVRGESLASIARFALEIEDIGPGRAAGSQPLPKIIKLTRRLSERMSILAGVLNALYVNGRDVGDPQWQLDDESFESLQSVPVAVRAGCDNKSSLSWYRFGLRYRSVAHVLGRAFPVADDLDDGATAEWVWRTRRAWLAGSVLPDPGVPNDEQGVLEAARMIMRS